MIPPRPGCCGSPLTVHTNAVRGVAFSPDGATLVTAGYDATALLWSMADPARPRQVSRIQSNMAGPILAVQFAPDGRTLATAPAYDAPMLWDVTDPVRPRQLGQTRLNEFDP